MIQRPLAFFMTLVMLLCVIPYSAAAATGFGNFSKTQVYTEQFTDVSAKDWFYSFVRETYELGLFDGRSPSIYDPEGNLTVGEAIKLAVSLHSIYLNGSPAIESSAPWYRFYVDYALTNHIIPEEFPDYGAYITRAQSIMIFASALPPEAYTPINSIASDVIPDISDESYSTAVYKLYRAGVVTGVDSKGTFKPDTFLTRAEAAVIMVRIAEPDLRTHVMLGNPFNRPPPEIDGVPNTAYFTLNSENTYNIYSRSDYASDKYAVVTVGDASIATCVPGKWNKALHILPLTIKALSYGSTNVKLDLFSSSDNSLLGSRIIAVNVINPASSSTAYYPGFYPVPDFGALIGIESSSGAVLVSPGGSTYVYKTADIPDLNGALNSYASLMEQNGFRNTSKSSGADSFTNYIYGWAVMVIYQNTANGNILSEYIQVMILPNPYN